ncbi:MAG: alpha-amylase family glycosyl hydrolase [Bacteroidota bacterium]
MLRNSLSLFLLLPFLLACETTTESTTPPSENDTSVARSATQDMTNGLLQNPDWSKNAVIYEVNLRQYTEEGTLTAFAERLPQLQKLGVDILWLMPVQPIGKKNRKGELGSYYSIQDYTAINPEYGSMEDFKALVSQAHDLGFKVILDWVANHTAWDHVWTETHPEWYIQDAAGNFQAPVADWSDVIDLDYGQPALRNAMIEAMQFWVEETDVDGFRCDVANMVPLDFWREARTQLNTVKPLFMLGEMSDPAYHEVFEMSYAWDLHHIFNEVAQGTKNAFDIRKQLQADQDSFPEGAYRMHFTSNHDENSWQGTTQERLGDAAESFAVLSYLLPGMPLIYSGQEAGLNKRLAFFEKDPISWPQRSRMRQIYQTLNTLVESEAALWQGPYQGSFELVNTANDALMLVFIRRQGNSEIVGLFNLSPAGQEVQIYGDQVKGIYQNAFTGQSLEMVPGVTQTFEPWGYGVLVK